MIIDTLKTKEKDHHQQLFNSLTTPVGPDMIVFRNNNITTKKEMNEHWRESTSR